MTKSPTDQQLDDIEARAQAATDGPWDRYGYGPNFFANTSGPYLRGVGDFNFGVGEQADADEEFVRHAVEDVRALVAEVRRLRAELDAEDPARIDRIRPEFDRGASVEAIDHQIRRARRQRGLWDIRMQKLAALRERRAAEMEAGVWPQASADSGARAVHPARPAVSPTA